MREDGGICLKYLKGGGTEERGGNTKTLKGGWGKLGQRVGNLKREWGGCNPLTNCDVKREAKFKTFFNYHEELQGNVFKVERLAHLKVGE